MSHWAPSISSYGFSPSGELTITWAIDNFFADSDPPDDISIELNGMPYKEHLGSGAREIQIKHSDLAPLGSTVAVTVVFVWTAVIADSKASSVLVNVPAATPNVTSQVPSPPTITFGPVEPKTLQHANRIKISWRSYSYTDGRISWGPVTDPTRNTSGFSPGGGLNPNYSGDYTAEIPRELAGNMITFKVEVRNTIQGSGNWIGSAINVKAALNFRSLRAFIVASSISLPTKLKTHLGNQKSLRSVMGI